MSAAMMALILRKSVSVRNLSSFGSWSQLSRVNELAAGAETGIHAEKAKEAGHRCWCLHGFFGLTGRLCWMVS